MIQYPVKPEPDKLGVFQYPLSPKARVPQIGTREPAPTPTGQPDEQFIIQGKSANSFEWTGWQALLALGWSNNTLRFQVAELGGRELGGTVIDVVVFTRPLLTPIFFNGGHWHKGEQARDDMIIHERLADELPDLYFPAVDLWDGDLIDIETAKWALMDTVGRA